MFAYRKGQEGTPKVKVHAVNADSSRVKVTEVEANSFRAFDFFLCPHAYWCNASDLYTNIKLVALSAFNNVPVEVEKQY